MTWPTPLTFILQHLPEWPPAQALCGALNIARPHLWPEEDFSWLHGKTVRLAVLDLGTGLTLGFDGMRFVPQQGPGDVTLGANLADYLVLIRRKEDPDTLFFQRRLIIEGDTELGLTLKNILDATDLGALKNIVRHSFV